MTQLTIVKNSLTKFVFNSKLTCIRHIVHTFSCCNFFFFFKKVFTFCISSVTDVVTVWMKTENKNYKFIFFSFFLFSLSALPTSTKSKADYSLRPSVRLLSCWLELKSCSLCLCLSLHTPPPTKIFVLHFFFFLLKKVLFFFWLDIKICIEVKKIARII